MRIAIAGKGGVGKTTLTGLLAQAFLKKGYRTLAIDSDSNPSLALSLGVSEEQANRMPTLSDLPAPLELESKHSLNMLPECSYETPSGVPVILMGRVRHANQGCFCRGYTLVHKVLDALGRENQMITLADMSSGLEYLQRGTVKYLDVLLIVAEPYYRSLEAALKIKALGEELSIKHIYAIANKMRGEQDTATLRQYFAEQQVPLIAEFPYHDVLMNSVGTDHLSWKEGRVIVKKVLTQLESDHRANLISDIIFSLSEKFLLTNRAELSQREILAVRYLAKREQMTVGQLAESIKAAMSTTTAVIDKLVQKRFARRFHSKKDRRIVHVSLTDSGKAFFKNHVDAYENLTREIMDSLSDKEEAFLVKLMGKINLN